MIAGAILDAAAAAIMSDRDLAVWRRYHRRRSPHARPAPGPSIGDRLADRMLAWPHAVWALAILAASFALMAILAAILAAVLFAMAAAL